MPDIRSIRDWLKGAKEQYSSCVRKCILFGSFLRSDVANDVDVIIIATEWDIRDVIKELKSSFRTRFGLPLHVQLFHVSQKSGIMYQMHQRNARCNRLQYV